MGNPLLSPSFHIPFKAIQPRHVAPGVKQILQRAQHRIDAVAAHLDPPTYANTLEALDSATQEASEALAPVHHLLSVAETPELRAAFNSVLPEITRFWSRLPLNEKLWERVRAFASSPEGRDLEGLRARHLDKTLREFRRAGADLAPAKKKRLEEISLELAKLQRRFSENVLDATAAYRLQVRERCRLDGLPDGPVERFRAAAREEGQEGWILTLDFPSYEPVMKYARDRSLRKELHGAFVGRCRGDDFDNLPLIPRILFLRQEMAELLGYPDFPDYKLEDAMAKSGHAAMAFEGDLETRTRPYWERDLAELRAHAGTLGIPGLQPWDVAFVAESLRKEQYDIDDEQLRPFFSLPRVLEGLFALTERVFGLTVSERENHQVWHSDVRYYELRDEEGVHLGSFYTDWLPRREKRQGAWMNDFLTGGPVEEGGFKPHLGFIAGNFSPPEKGEPSLLTHREVQTVFHEFGHLLHHLTSRVPIPGRSGMNVAWDWVELPSQIMENWTWEKEALDLFARHVRTGKGLSGRTLEKMVAARRFMGGWYQMRQLSLGTLDLALHLEFAPRLGGEEEAYESAPQEVMRFAEERLKPFSPSVTFARNNILTTFSHLFSGGYAAGYYSYLWSEVLEADAFTRFLREGVLNRATGRAYLDAILSRGDSAEPEDLFKEFMGREPDPTALLARNLGPLPDSHG